MSQDYNIPPAGDESGQTALKTTIPNALEALRSEFSGSAEPSAKTPYQRWADTANGMAQRRNAANDGWNAEGALGVDMGRQTVSFDLGDLTVTDDKLVLVATRPIEILQVSLIAEGASGGGDDASNKWVWQLENVTQTLNLFSEIVGTFDSDGTIGGGAIAAETAYHLYPDQNATLATDDVLQFKWTETGAAGSVTGVTLQITFAER